MKPMPIAFAFLTAALLGACAEKVETQPISADMAPAVARVSAAGDTWVRLNKISGKEETGRYMAVENGIYSWEDSEGCKSKGRTGTFAVFLSWENCSGSTGTHTYSGDGTLFPLEVGKSISREVSGQNAKGDTWNTTQTCTVAGTARVTVPAGAFDTYHVQCEDTWSVRDYYHAPELGVAVISRRSRKDRADVVHHELISFTPGA